MDEFKNIKGIGAGNFSVIFRGESKKDGKFYAIKHIEGESEENKEGSRRFYGKTLPGQISRLPLCCETSQDLSRLNELVFQNGLS